MAERVSLLEAVDASQEPTHPLLNLLFLSRPPLCRLLPKKDDEKLLDVVEAHRGEALRERDWENISANFYGRSAAQCEAR